MRKPIFCETCCGAGLGKSQLYSLGVHYLKQLGRLIRSKDKPQKQIQKLMSQIANSRSARIFSVLRAYVDVPHMTGADVLAEVDRVNLDTVTNEKTRVRALNSVTKSSGLRLVALTGRRRKAQQLILRDLLLAVHGDISWDSAVRGAGGDKEAFRKINQAIVDDDCRYWLTLDIKNFFPSLRPGHLSGFILPKRWINGVIFLPEVTQIVFKDQQNIPCQNMGNVAQIIGDDHGALALPLSSYGEQVYSKLKLVQQGLIQGDAIAPQIARMVLGRELQATLGEMGVTWFSHCDDLVIGARSHAELVAASEALVHRLNSHPAGPLEFHQGEIRTVDNGFEFLGYFAKTGKTGELRIKPSKSRFDRMHAEVWNRLLKAESGGTWRVSDFRKVATNYAERWFSAKSAWTKGEWSYAYLKADIDEILNLWLYRLFEDGDEELEWDVDEETAEASALKWPSFKLAQPFAEALKCNFTGEG